MPCVCHSATAFKDQGQVLAGIDVYYPDDNYQPVSRYNVKACNDFFSRATSWANSFSSLCPRGKPSKIVCVGSGEFTALGCASRHDLGGAFDLTGAQFVGKYWYNNNYQSDKKFTMGIEASAHRLFTYTLGYNYNAGHHNHIHFDDTFSGPQFSTTRSSQVNFVQASLKAVFGLAHTVGGAWDAVMGAQSAALLLNSANPNPIAIGELDWLAKWGREGGPKNRYALSDVVTSRAYRLRQEASQVRTLVDRQVVILRVQRRAILVATFCGQFRSGYLTWTLDPPTSAPNAVITIELAQFEIEWTEGGDLPAGLLTVGSPSALEAVRVWAQSPGVLAAIRDALRLLESV